MGIRASNSETMAKLHAEEAKKQTNIAVAALDSLRTTQYKINFTEGKDFMSEAEYLKAAEKFGNAYEIIQNDSARILRDNCFKLNSLKEKYEEFKAIARRHYNNREFIKAMEAYNDALSTGYNNQEINNLKNNLLREALRVYQKDLQDYEEWGDEAMVSQTHNKIDRIRYLNKIQ
jgi:hypothetical protein